MGQACGYMCNKIEGGNNTIMLPNSEQEKLRKFSSFEEISNVEYSKAVNKINKDFLISSIKSNLTINVDEYSKTLEQIDDIILTFKLVKLQAVIRGASIRKRIKIEIAENYIELFKANYEYFNVKKIEEYEAKFPEFKGNSLIPNNDRSLGPDTVFFNKMLLKKIHSM